MDKPTILKEWLQNDAKLLQVVLKIASFDEFLNDHNSRCKKLKHILVVQTQTLDDNKWVNSDRLHDESGTLHDEAWCCLFPARCKNCIYVKDKQLRLSTCATGMDIDSHEKTELLETGQCVQVGEDRQEHNLLFTLEELRNCLKSLTK